MDAAQRGYELDLSIVLVNTNGMALTEQCIQTIERSGTRCSYEIIVSDNVSTDGSREWLYQVERINPRIRCVYNTENRGFGVANNSAVPYCRGRHILFLNNDTLVLEPLDDLVAAADRLGPRCGALGGRVLNADKTIQYTCRLPYTLPVLISSLTLAFADIRPGWVRKQELRDWDYASERDVAMVSGCYILVPRNVLDHVGVFDPNIFLFFEETDLCYRIRDAGYLVRYVPVSTIIHLGGGSTRRGGLSERWLNQATWSTRYFARNHMGRTRARLLAISIWLCWLPMWAVFAVLGMVIAKPAPRAAFRHRARLLRHMLATMPHHRFPPRAAYPPRLT